MEETQFLYELGSSDAVWTEDMIEEFVNKYEEMDFEP